MQIKLSQNLKELFPNIKIGILELKSIANKKHDSRLEEEKRRVEDFIRNNYSDFSNFETIKKYNQFFKKFEKTYPIQFQIKSILSGKSIPSASTVVEAMFMAELKSMFLTAGHDLDSLKDSLQTKLTIGNEKYVKINNQEQILKPDDIITQDSEGIISSVLYGPDFRTRITENTRNCLFFSYFPYGEDNENIKQHFNNILENIRIFSNELGAGEVKILQL